MRDCELMVSLSNVHPALAMKESTAGSQGICADCFRIKHKHVKGSQQHWSHQCLWPSGREAVSLGELVRMQKVIKRLACMAVLWLWWVIWMWIVSYNLQNRNRNHSVSLDLVAQAIAQAIKMVWTQPETSELLYCMQPLLSRCATWLS